jgi:hypothetical protein
MCAAVVITISACGEDAGDGGSDETALVCKAAELVVTGVAARFEVNLPQSLDALCVTAFAAYRAQQSPLLVELSDGSTLTIPLTPQFSEPPTTLSVEFQQLLVELESGGATVNP